MTTSYRDWQPGHLRLSAPALQILRKGTDHDATDILRLAVRELVGLGMLTPTTLRAGEGRASVHTAAFATGRPAPDDLEASLRSVVDAYSKANAREGIVTIQDFVRSLRDAHDDDLAKWVEDDVVPVVIERGLYEKQEGKRLGVIPTSSIELTAEGRAAQAQLDASIEYVAKNWDDWAAKDEQRAQTLLDLAGSGVLLVPDIYDAVIDFRASQRGDKAYPAETLGAAAGAPRFDIDRLALYADDLKLMDEVFAYTDIEE